MPCRAGPRLAEPSLALPGLDQPRRVVPSLPRYVLNSLGYQRYQCIVNHVRTNDGHAVFARALKIVQKIPFLPRAVNIVARARDPQVRIHGVAGDVGVASSEENDPRFPDGGPSVPDEGFDRDVGRAEPQDRKGLPDREAPAKVGGYPRDTGLPVAPDLEDGDTRFPELLCEGYPAIVEPVLVIP